MLSSTSKHRNVSLLGVVFLGGLVLLLGQALPQEAMGQSPTAEKQGGNAHGVAKPKSSDQDTLQGRWQISSIALQGKTIKREDQPAGWKAMFDQDVVIEQDRLAHAQVEGAKFQLEETCEPKRITFPDKDGQLAFRGIYTVDGDTLTVCVNGDGKVPSYPEQFATKEGTPLVLMTLKKRLEKE